MNVASNEHLLTKVLLSLWQRPETTIAELMREVGPGGGVQEGIEVLRDRGCLIEQSPTEVRLVSAGISCWRDIIEHHAACTHARFGKRAIILSRTGSTNDIAWQYESSPDADGLLVAADEQSAGRGRFGHSWCAKAEQSILMSLLLRIDDTTGGGVDTLTLLAGLATARAIEHLGIARTTIKWPNDILLNNRKLAGILVERRNKQVVIGIGINVAQTAADFPAEVCSRATSLYQATGKMIERLRVLIRLLEELEKILSAPQHPEAWLAEWKSRCEMLNTRITVGRDGTTLSGLVIDIDPLTGLILRDDHGGTHFLSAQTTTLSI